MRRVHAVLTLLLACLLLLPAAAGATGRSVVRDCTDNGRIDSDHSQSDYNDALRNMPSDVDEYTDCRQIIERAKREDAKKSSTGSGPTGGGGGGGPTGTGGGPSFTPAPTTAPTIPPTRAERDVLGAAGAAGGGAVQVAGEPIVPGGTGLTEAAFRHDVPGPLLVLLVLLGAGALAMTVSGARARGLRAPSSALRVFDRVFPRRA
jgi:hypothetical protein